MTNFLVKKFVPRYEDLEDQCVRTAYGVLSSIVGIICNVFLFVIKFVIGLLIGSITVSADGFNNLSDAASSIISFIGVKVANRPADKEHPFGHGRAEYIAALIVSFLVIEVGFTCAKSSFSKIIHPEAITFNWVLVIILTLSILVKVWLAMFNRNLGKRINSKVMLATSADARNDVIITSATVLSILVSKFTGLSIDGYAGLVVSIFVLISGFNIAKDTLEPLLGEAIDRELYVKITEKVESYDGILDSHDLIVHSYGPTRRMATIHAEVPNTMTMEVAHELIDQIEREVSFELDVFLTIHVDPVEINDEQVHEMKEMINTIVKKLEPEASFHDFRIVKGDHHTNILFDLVLPFSYSADEIHEISTKVREQVRAYNSNYQCIITVENSFVSEK